MNKGLSSSKKMMETTIICNKLGDLISQIYNYFAFRKNGTVKANDKPQSDGNI